MELFTWKQNDFSGREFTVRSAEVQVGKLKFKGWSSYNAVYTSGDISISFTNKGWFEQKVTIRYNGEVIGNGRTTAFGATHISLISGENFKLESKAFSQNKTLTDDTGRSVINFEQPVLSFGKGSMAVADDVPELTKALLVGAGLYFKAVSDSQAAILIAVFMPIFIQIIT